VLLDVIIDDSTINDSTLNNPLINNPTFNGTSTYNPGTVINYDPSTIINGPNGSVWTSSGIDNLKSLNIAAGGAITFNGVPLGGTCAANQFMIALSSTVVPSCAAITSIPGSVTIGSINITGTAPSLTFNGVPMGGTCAGSDFVNAISATGVPSCATPAGAGGGPPLPLSVANGGLGQGAAPAVGQILVASSATAYNPVTMTGDVSILPSGATTVHSISGTTVSITGTLTFPDGTTWDTTGLHAPTINGKDYTFHDGATWGNYGISNLTVLDMAPSTGTIDIPANGPSIQVEVSGTQPNQFWDYTGLGNIQILGLNMGTGYTPIAGANPVAKNSIVFGQAGVGQGAGTYTGLIGGHIFIGPTVNGQMTNLLVEAQGAVVDNMGRYIDVSTTSAVPTVLTMLHGVYTFGTGPAAAFATVFTPTVIATIDSTGINLPTGSTYKINGVALGGGGGTVTSITAGTGLTGGAITTTGTIALGANPAGGQLNYAPIASPTLTGIATTPTLVVSNTGSTSIFFGNTTTPGASLLSTGVDSFHFTAGAYYNGTNFIAAATTSQDVGMYGTGFYFSQNAGLTVGNSFTQTTIATIDATGINIPTGSIYKVNGVAIGGGGLPAGGTAPQIVGYTTTSGVGEAATISGDATLTRVSAGTWGITVTATNGASFSPLATTNIAPVANGGTGTNTAPTSGKMLIAQSATQYLPETVSGDATLASTGALTVTKTSGTSFGALATATTPLSIANGGEGSATAPSAGQIRVAASATSFPPVSLSGDATITSAGALTVAGLKGVAVPTLAAGYLQYTGSAFAWSTPGGAASVTPWTPALQLGGGSVGMTYSHQTGYYTQNGKQITAYFDISLSAKGTSTGSAQICGLPVATYTSAGNQGPWLVNNQFGMTGLTGILVTLITGNTTCLYIYQQASTGAALGSQAFDTNFTNTSYLIGNVTYLTN
jgi:hypothetical protein